MRKFALLLAALVALCAAAMADETQFIQHDPFALDDVWAQGSTSPGEYHYYPFTVEAAGLVTVRVQMFCAGQAQLLDADLVQWDEGYFNGTAGAPETQDFAYYLEPGEYCVRVGNDSSQGNFRLKGTLAPCPSTETPDNDTYLGAQALPSGETLSGVLTQWDEHDFYTFALPEETQLYLTANSSLESLQPNLALYDGDMVKVAEAYGVKGYAEEFLLPAGVYYLDMWGNRGPYTLKAVYAPQAEAALTLDDAPAVDVAPAIDDPAALDDAPALDDPAAIDDVPAIDDTPVADDPAAPAPTPEPFVNERDYFDVAPDEDFLDEDSATDAFGELLLELLRSGL